MRWMLVPMLVAAVAFTYVAAYPSADATPSTDITPSSGATPAPSTTASSGAASSTAGALPDGVSGRLTYRTLRDVVTAELPSLREIARRALTPERPGVASADGAWHARHACSTSGCGVAISGQDGRAHTLDLGAHFAGETLAWSPEGHALAFALVPADGPYARALAVVDDPITGAVRTLLDADGRGVFGFTWIAGDALLVSVGGGATGVPELMVVRLDGGTTTLARTGATVPYFYPSPDLRRVAFTQPSAGSWRIMVADLDATMVQDLGAMGSDGAGAADPQLPPDSGKGPMYVAWSPDGARLAFGGGFEPPYTMTVVDVATGAAVRTEFSSGYPGEIRWTADGARIGVSTYDLERTHHETYVVDPSTGAAKRIIDGCVIVWSPDGRFLAVHAEQEPGIAIVDVETGEYGFITHISSDAPLSWE